MVCDHWNIPAHAFHSPNLHSYKHREHKQKWYHLVIITPSSHIHSKCWRASLPCPRMADAPSMAFQVYQISRWHLVQNSQLPNTPNSHPGPSTSGNSQLPPKTLYLTPAQDGILKAPTFWIHVHYATSPHKTPDLQPLWMTCSCTPNLVFKKCNYTGTHAFNTSTKSNRVWLANTPFLLLQLSKYFQCPSSALACPHCTCPQIMAFHSKWPNLQMTSSWTLPKKTRLVGVSVQQDTILRCSHIFEKPNTPTMRRRRRRRRRRISALYKSCWWVKWNCRCTHRGQMAQARRFSSSWSTSLFHSMCWWSNCLLLV